MSIRIKPGATLSLSAIDDGGDLTGTVITASVGSNDFTYPLTVEVIDLTVGQYTLKADCTSTFPVGRLNCDVKYVAQGIVTYSNTFSINVEAGITP